MDNLQVENLCRRPGTRSTLNDQVILEFASHMCVILKVSVVRNEDEKKVNGFIIPFNQKPAIITRNHPMNATKHRHFYSI